MDEKKVSAVFRFSNWMLMVMDPTDEQEDILKSNGRVIRINARAGTGKTTTLCMFANRHLDKKILYLVFNKKAQKEAESKFPSNVKVKTVHSLARGYMRQDYENLKEEFSPKDLLASFHNISNQQVLASICHDFLVFFLNSACERMEDAAGEFERTLPDTVKGLFNRYQTKIIDSARELALLWYKKEKPCPHDFYLNRFHRTGKFNKALARYDIILVDEAQDLSGVMVDALRKCDKRMVIVGDTHQQIYGFRYAVDAMRKLPADEEHNLTLSFRFGKQVADLATLFIREGKGEGSFCIRGNPQKTSVIVSNATVPSVPCAILSRTNLALFANAVGLRSKGRTFRFERDLGSSLWRILDVYWLASGKKSKIRNEWIQTFDDLKSLEAYADNCEDFQLKSMAEIIHRYSRLFPDFIFEMAEVNKNNTDGSGAKEVVLSTIHASKGQEYERVYIDSDVADALTFSAKAGKEKFDEEINVAYVGFTRSIEQLLLPSSFHHVLSPKWERFLKSSENARDSSKPRPSGIAVPNNQKISSLQKRRVGDKVKTPDGPGTIVKIIGEKYVVDINGRHRVMKEKGKDATRQGKSPRE